MQYQVARAMDELHTYNDGSKLYRMPVNDLLAIPIWKGNRIIDMTHVDAIKCAIERDKTNIESLDSGYQVIVYTETDAVGNTIIQKYVIDGQHRLRVIRESIRPLQTFAVTVTEKVVADEAEAIAYFNRINSTKPLQYNEDPVLIVNKYIPGIVDAFPSKKNLIRSKKTKRPYLYVEDLRTELLAHVDALKRITPDEFVRRMLENNASIVRQTDVELLLAPRVKDHAIKESAVKLGFGIGLHLNWVATALRA